VQGTTPTPPSRPRLDDKTLAELDGLVLSAVHGDGRAIGAIAFAFGPSLYAAALGIAGDPDEATAVLQSFFDALSTRSATRSPPAAGSALAWLHAVVRDLAEEARLAPTRS
jgi:hypothetical protein